MPRPGHQLLWNCHRAARQIDTRSSAPTCDEVHRGRWCVSQSFRSAQKEGMVCDSPVATRPKTHKWQWCSFQRPLSCTNFRDVVPVDPEHVVRGQIVPVLGAKGASAVAKAAPLATAWGWDIGRPRRNCTRSHDLQSFNDGNLSTSS